MKTKSIFTHSVKHVTVIAAITLLVACGGTKTQQIAAAKSNKDRAPKNAPSNFSHLANAKPKTLPKSRYGNPKSYVISGKRYHVLDTAHKYSKVGEASWYGEKFHGRLTSNREVYDMYAMTAASTELPLPTFARVTNLDNGRSIIVKVNDRGPFIDDRIIDLSYAAAHKLGYVDKGVTTVRVEAIHPETQQPLHETPTEIGVMYVQVASFSDRDNAERLGQRLTGLIDKPVSIEETLHDETPVYRVQIGPVKDHHETTKIRSALESHGFEDVIAVSS